MKKIGLVIALFAGVTFGNTLLAQDVCKKDRKEMEKKTPEERAAHKTAKMTKELSLTEEQVAQVEDINLDLAVQMEALHKEIKALREKGKLLREEHKKELKTVLTDEQELILEQKMEEKRKKREEHKKNAMPPAPPVE